MDKTTAVVVWVVAALAFFGIEATTVSFVAIYFGVGALASALVAALGAGLAVQLLVFSIVSVLTLLSTRRWVSRGLTRVPVVRSNVNALVGRRGVVTHAITAAAGRGQIRVGTEFWTARPYIEDSPDIAEGETVEVLAVEGVTALVLPLDRALNA